MKGTGNSGLSCLPPPLAAARAAACRNAAHLAVALSFIGLVSGEAEISADQISASLRACQQNHASFDPPTCPFYFERDSSSQYFCSDGSCAVSDAIRIATGGLGSPGETCTDNFQYSGALFMQPEFVVANKAPAAISCSRAIVNSHDTKCADTWEDTPIDSNVRNFLFPDFIAPMFQTMSCCSSVGRFGFAYDGFRSEKGQVHNPFYWAPVIVGCFVSRRSVRGDSCGDGSSWGDFEGSGVCGVSCHFKKSDRFDSFNTLSSSSCRPDDLQGIQNAVNRATGNTSSTSSYCAPTFVQSECTRLEPKYSLGCSEGSFQEMEEHNNCGDETGFLTKSGLCFSCRDYAPTGYVADVRTPLGPLNAANMSSCVKCKNLFRALNAFPCSGQQGNFVSNSTFRICKSACQRLFDTCGLPTHRGGLLIQSSFYTDTNEILGDYSTPEGLCKILWNPHPASVWIASGYTLEVVDDSKSTEADTCVTFERAVGDFSGDTQNFIFDYEAIRNGEGYCSTEDPLLTPMIHAATLLHWTCCRIPAAFPVVLKPVEAARTEARRCSLWTIREGASTSRRGGRGRTRASR
mmetsp:Transcript_76376/g.124151  ORF Transcript_76376/g.124151 Transcript_76376/m.124151 type:complete len:576 (-) Transcript_76376:456-2183(-)